MGHELGIRLQGGRVEKAQAFVGPKIMSWLSSWCTCSLHCSSCFGLPYRSRNTKLNEPNTHYKGACRQAYKGLLAFRVEGLGAKRIMNSNQSTEDAHMDLSNMLAQDMCTSLTPDSSPQPQVQTAHWQEPLRSCSQSVTRQTSRRKLDFFGPLGNYLKACEHQEHESLKPQIRRFMR